jgi:hypothetical protein
MTNPPMLPTIRIGAYALVMVASDRLSSSPNSNPTAQPGHDRFAHPITNPMANRLRDAPRRAAVLSGTTPAASSQPPPAERDARDGSPRQVGHW